MPTNANLNGTNYPVPNTGESAWGPETSAYLLALATAFPQLGGTWSLISELDLGAAFGVKSLYFKSRTANPAAAGILRLANLDTINFRNAANGADDLLFPGVAANSQAADALYWKNATSGLTQQLSDQPYCEINTSVQSIPSGASTVVILTNKVTDTDSAYSVGTGLFTVPANKGGIYLVCAGWETATAPVAAAEYSIFVQVNGTQVASQRLTTTPSATSIEAPAIATLVNAAAGATIGFNAYQTSGGARALDGATNGNRLTIKRLA